MELLEPQKEPHKPISEQDYISDERVYLNDVRGWISRFRQCLAVLRANSYPCAIVAEQQPPGLATETGDIPAAKGEPAMVPLDFLGHLSFFQQIPRIDGLSMSVPFISLAETGRFTFVPKEQARQFFKSGLVDFVAGRLGNQAKKHPPNPVCGSGVHLTVTTKTSWLEIHSAPQFFGSWTHFGSPTSPVKDCIPAGYYFFRAMEWDTATSRYIQRYQSPAPSYIGGATHVINLPV